VETNHAWGASNVRAGGRWASPRFHAPGAELAVLSAPPTAVPVTRCAYATSAHHAILRLRPREGSVITRHLKKNLAHSNQPDALQRCRWATTDLMIAYHDKEWGVPVHDDR